MLAWLSGLFLLGGGAFGARMHARNFVREYIRELVRERLRAALAITASQFTLLAVTAFGVHRLRDPLGREHRRGEACHDPGRRDSLGAYHFERRPRRLV